MSPTCKEIGVVPVQQWRSDSSAMVEAIAKTIDDALHYCPESAREEAILAALKVERDGGTFAQAMEAAEETMVQNGYRFIRGFLMFPARNGRRDHELRMRVAARGIEKAMEGKSVLEISQALDRARRVIEGNGNVSTALRYSIGPDWLAQLRSA